MSMAASSYRTTACQLVDDPNASSLGLGGTQREVMDKSGLLMQFQPLSRRSRLTIGANDCRAKGGHHHHLHHCCHYHDHHPHHHLHSHRCCHHLHHHHLHRHLEHMALLTTTSNNRRLFNQAPTQGKVNLRFFLFYDLFLLQAVFSNLSCVRNLWGTNMVLFRSVIFTVCSTFLLLNCVHSLIVKC